MKIERLSNHPSLVEVVTDWLLAEWPGSATGEETFAMFTSSAGTPPTLTALAEGEPIGLLGFKRHEFDGAGAVADAVGVGFAT